MADPVEIFANILHEIVDFAGGARGPLSTAELQSHHAAITGAVGSTARPEPPAEEQGPVTAEPASAMAHEEAPSGEANG